uniref:Putative ixodes 10 kDa peptide protein n=1 Tax=Ixodes ricinus TaxID=34613 RepID=A0A0K8RIH8_IXORI
MCCNISNMLLVLFAVVLILPESQGKGSENNFLECYLAVRTGGDIFCQIYGYDRSESGSLNYKTCELGCGGKNVQLPKAACSRGAHSGCTKELAKTLKKWSADMTKRKHDLIKKWCN